MELLEYLSTHPTVPAGPAPANYQPADAIFGFGRKDPAVAITATALYRQGLAPLVLFTGGIGKDSGPILTRYKVPEAAFQAALAEHAGVPADAIVIEDQAKHGGENCLLGYRAVRDRLGRPPASLILVVHPLSLRRLVEVFGTIAESERWPHLAIQSCPTGYTPDPASPADRIEAAKEMMLLAKWPHEQGSNDRPKLRPQPDLPAHLVDIARRILAEQMAA